MKKDELLQILRQSLDDGDDEGPDLHLLLEHNLIIDEFFPILEDPFYDRQAIGFAIKLIRKIDE